MKQCAKCKEIFELRYLVLVGEPPAAVWLCKSCEGSGIDILPICQNCEE